MVTPRKLYTKSREDKKKIVTDIIKTIKKETSRKKKEGDVTEVKVEVWEIGHGQRPFGTHFPNDYIDFSVAVKGDYNTNVVKFEGLGKGDLAEIGKGIRETMPKTIEVEDKDIFFGYGNFTPDMSFPTYFRTFKTKKARKAWMEMREGNAWP